MTKLEQHRFLLYGRSGLSILLFIAAMGLGAVDTLTTAGDSLIWVASGMLIASIVALPRTTVPQNEQARQDASDEELEQFRSLRPWLTWTRLIYLAIAVAVLGLPELL